MVNAIFPIVEGHGERDAVPILLRRFAHDVYGNFGVRILPPYRLPRGKLTNQAEFTRVVELGARKVTTDGQDGAIVVLLDADDDCPAQLGPTLLGQIANIWPAVRKSVVLPKHEFEAWFLAAAISLRGRHRIRATAIPPPEPEAIRGAKKYLERHLMEAGSVYSPTVDQPSLAAAFSFVEARACPSFDKLWRDLDVLFE